MNHEASPAPDAAEAAEATCRLRLYIAGASPNSARAESNLLAMLETLGRAGQELGLEIVDVFTHPRRAISDSVIVTPTLIGLGRGGRAVMMGDLSDTALLRQLLEHLTARVA
jgi:circadian clock protein KaiB